MCTVFVNDTYIFNGRNLMRERTLKSWSKTLHRFWHDRYLIQAIHDAAWEYRLNGMHPTLHSTHIGCNISQISISECLYRCGIDVRTSYWCIGDWYQKGQSTWLFRSKIEFDAGSTFKRIDFMKFTLKGSYYLQTLREFGNGTLCVISLE